MEAKREVGANDEKVYLLRDNTTVDARVSKYLKPQKYCTPIMFTRFVCALLSLCARKFPAKSETQDIMKFIVGCNLYVSKSSAILDLRKANKV